MWLLENYEWPGNIRELENAVVRAVALCDQIVRPEDLPERVRRSYRPGVSAAATGSSQLGPVNSTDDSVLSLAELERRHITRVLARTGGNKQAAARILGIDRTTLQRKLERYELEGGGTNAAAQS
jgi:DNA-binding NtrC family response regulator